MKSKIIFTSLVIIIAILAIVSIIGMSIYNHQPQVLQGQIEATEIKISGKLLGRIDKFYVQEGELVKQGDTLVMINSPETNALLQSASAMENVAKYQNQKVDAGARIQIIQSLKEAWEAAKANYELAMTTNTRVQKLYADSVATPQKRDEANTLAKAAQAAEKAAYYQYQLALSGAQTEDKESAKALVTAAQGGVNQVQALLSDSKLTAPANGEISAIYPTIGELVMPGAPIMNLVELDSCYVVLNVREDLLPNFYMGKLFMGKVPAIGNKEIVFEIFYMSPMGSFATWRSTKQTGSYDIVTFQIKARPVPEKPTEDGTYATQADIARLRPGMSVLVTMHRSK